MSVELPVAHGPVPQGPILVLGMHRSGTSCLAGMLVAAGGVVPGPEVRNWDNPRGHYEAADLIRLNEDVLAHSGGHWLEAPEAVLWTDGQARDRDSLLSTPGITVWKDPRTLLVWPFWAASARPRRAVGVVRHPLAVARSLASWRGLPVDQGLRLWLAHLRPLAACGVDVLVFDRPRDRFVGDVARVAAAFGLSGDLDRIGAAYVEDAVHHDAGEGPSGDPALLDACLAVYERLGGEVGAARAAFPWAEIGAAQRALAAGAVDQAQAHALAALRGGGDPAAIIAPLASEWLRLHHGERLLGLLDELDLPPALDGLLRGKAWLDARRPREAAAALTSACAVAAPLYEARHLLPQALWDAGDRDGADRALEALLPLALYPFRVWARRAEWAWARQRRSEAFAWMEEALKAAPQRRHGRLLHRRAAWKQAIGDLQGAAADRALAAERDPSFQRGSGP